MQAGIVTQGISWKQSQINIEGSLKLLEQSKLKLDWAFFDKFTTELERAANITLDQQFSCAWQNIEVAINNAIGKHSEIQLTEDYFANKNPKVEGKIIKTGIHQISKHYTNYHGSTLEDFIDKETGISMSNVEGHRSHQYDDILPCL